MSLGLQVRRVPQVQGHHWFGDPVVMGGWRKSSQLLLGKKVVIATLWNIKNRKKSATVRLVRSKYFNQLFMTYSREGTEGTCAFYLAQLEHAKRRSGFFLHPYPQLNTRHMI